VNHDGEQTDQQLLDAIRRGDAEAFETLYHRYGDWVHRLALRFTRDQDEALDVLQETFAYLLKRTRGPRRLRLSAKLSTFLYPAVRNISISMGRGRRRLVVGPVPERTAPPPPVQRTDLAAVLERIPEPQREVLMMRFVHDMALDEIARALSVPLGTVKSRLHHALKNLREDERTERYFQGE
jgi:RNA polymerase sigma-70 factor (ECF subfamily)